MALKRTKLLAVATNNIFSQQVQTVTSRILDFAAKYKRKFPAFTTQTPNANVYKVNGKDVKKLWIFAIKSVEWTTKGI